MTSRSLQVVEEQLFSIVLSGISRSCSKLPTEFIYLTSCILLNLAKYNDSQAIHIQKVYFLGIQMDNCHLRDKGSLHWFQMTSKSPQMPIKWSFGKNEILYSFNLDPSQNEPKAISEYFKNKLRNMIGQTTAKWPVLFK